MRDSTKDRVEGKFHEVKGSVKEVIGKAVHSPRVALEGHNEKTVGRIQEDLGKARKAIGR